MVVRQAELQGVLPHGLRDIAKSVVVHIVVVIDAVARDVRHISRKRDGWHYANR